MNLVYDTERNHATFSAQLGIPTSYVSFNLVHDIPDHDLKLKALVKYGTVGAVIAYGAEKQITANSALDFAINVAIPQGVSVKIRLKRANQNYTFQVRKMFLLLFHALLCHIHHYTSCTSLSLFSFDRSCWRIL